MSTTRETSGEEGQGGGSGGGVQPFPNSPRHSQEQEQLDELGIVSWGQLWTGIGTEGAAIGVHQAIEKLSEQRSGGEGQQRQQRQQRQRQPEQAGQQRRGPGRPRSEEQR